MRTYAFLILLSVCVVTLVLWALWQKESKAQNEDCFDAEEFKAIYDYAIWKKRSSKIGKVLAKGYRVEIDKATKTLVFKNDKQDYTIFKVSAENGIILLPVKQPNRLKTKARQAYCELVKRARLHPVPPQQ